MSDQMKTTSLTFTKGLALGAKQGLKHTAFRAAVSATVLGIAYGAAKIAAKHSE